MRVFSNAEGAYGSNVNHLVDSGTWQDDGELATTFVRRKGFAYGASKAALIRMAGVLKVEYADKLLSFFNMEPGLVMTEAMDMRPDREDFINFYGGAPMQVPAAVVAWLATAPEARELNGQTIMAQRHCLKLNLVPEWQPRRRSKS